MGWLQEHRFVGISTQTWQRLPISVSRRRAGGLPRPCLAKAGRTRVVAAIEVAGWGRAEQWLSDDNTIELGDNLVDHW